MISPRCGPAFIVMRIAALLALVFSSACHVAEEDLGPGFLPDSQVTGACGADPTSLAQIPNLLHGPFLILTGALYVVAMETPGDTAHETLWLVPMDGGAPESIATGQANIKGIDGQLLSYGAPAGGLVWTSSGADDAGTGGTIWTLDSSGAPAVVLSNRTALGSIVFDYGTIYWVEEGIDPSGQTFGAIMRGSTTPGEADVTLFQKTAADQIPRVFGFLANNFAWTTKPPAGGNFSQSALITAPSVLPFGAQTEIAGPDGGGVAAIANSWASWAQLRYFYSGPSGIMVVVPPGAPQLLLPLTDFVEGIVDFEGVLYFVLPPARTVGASPDGGGDGGAFVLPSAGSLWTFPDDGDGGASAMRQLAPDVDPATSFGVDSACVYWIDAVTSRVMMVHR